MIVESPLPSEFELVIFGITLNRAGTLRDDLAARARAARHFARAHILVIESDSTDSSLALLESLSKEFPQLRYHSLGTLREDYPLRTDRIARCGNANLKALDNDPLYANVTHVLVNDLDRVSREPQPEALASCFALDIPWNASFADQGDYHYDVWALRHPLWCPVGAWVEYEQLWPLFGERVETELARFPRMVHIAPERAPIEGESAFGGVARYRRDALCGMRYMGLNAGGAQICEHVALHEVMRKRGGHMYVNPALIKTHRTKHGGRKKLLRTLRRRVWNWFRGRDDG